MASGCCFMRHRDAAQAVLGEQDLVTGALQADADQPAHIRFVVDHQYAGHRPASIPATSQIPSACDPPR